MHIITRQTCFLYSFTEMQIKYSCIVIITISKSKATNVTMQFGGVLTSVFMTFSDSCSRCLRLQLLHKYSL